MAIFLLLQSQQLLLCFFLLLLHPTTPSPSPSPSPAPAPSNECTSVLLGLYPCLNFAGGQVAAPSANCCSSLSDIINNNVICLCYLFSGGSTTQLPNFNQTRASKLPLLCKVTTPDVSLCSAVGIPVSAPLASTLENPSGLAPTSPAETPSSSAPATSPALASATPALPSPAFRMCSAPRLLFAATIVSMFLLVLEM